MDDLYNIITPGKIHTISARGLSKILLKNQIPALWQIEERKLL
jgi:hypothetical protein